MIAHSALRQSVAAAVALTALHAQSPTFDAASIKLNPSPSLRHVVLPPTGGRLSTRNAALRLLIQTAYGVQDFQISGGPDWMNSAGYDVEAKAEGNPTRAQVWLMLQALLAERFKLKVHREMKEHPVYAMTVAKSGLKLPKAAEGECTAPPTLGPCGDLVVGAEKGELFVRGQQVPLTALATLLSTIIARPVIDRTSVTGKFDVNLVFVADDVTAGIPSPRRIGDGDQAMPPSVMTALNHQLGLKLDSSKGPIEMLVIDHVERATEN
jgi:uncharacterized protein (TIGR03435 family)